MTKAARTILKIWLGLCALLALTTAVAFVPLGAANFPIALAIAVAKAALVLWFFMELRGSGGLTRLFAAAGFFWLAILIVMTWADYAYRNDAPAPVEASAPVVR